MGTKIEIAVDGDFPLDRIKHALTAELKCVFGAGIEFDVSVSKADDMKTKGAWRLEGSDGGRRFRVHWTRSTDDVKAIHRDWLNAGLTVTREFFRESLIRDEIRQLLDAQERCEKPEKPCKPEAPKLVIGGIYALNGRCVQLLSLFERLSCQMAHVIPWNTKDGPNGCVILVHDRKDLQKVWLHHGHSENWGLRRE